MADKQINTKPSDSPQSHYASRRLVKTHNSASIDGIMMRKVRLFSVYPDGNEATITWSNQSPDEGVTAPPMQFDATLPMLAKVRTQDGFNAGKDEAESSDFYSQCSSSDSLTSSQQQYLAGLGQDPRKSGVRRSKKKSKV